MTSSTFSSAFRTRPTPVAAPGWYWVLPRVALVLFLAAIGALVWLLHSADQEDQRAALISDVLWMEQDLRFHLDRNVELIGQLGREAAEKGFDATALELRARSLVSNGQGLLSVERLVAVDAADEALAAPARLADRIGQAVYLPPRVLPDGDVQFDVLVPLGTDRGWMRGRYSLAQMLVRSVPWWFAERYAVEVIDNTERVLASKSKVASGNRDLGYSIAFEPPGHGLRLRVAAYRSETRLLPALLVVTLVGLALTMLWSLWALRRHLNRRLAAEHALREEHAFRTAMENSLIIGLRARPRRPHHARQSGVLPHGGLECRRADGDASAHALLGTRTRRTDPGAARRHPGRQCRKTRSDRTDLHAARR